MLTHEHVQHLAKRNDTLSQKIDKLRGKAARVTKHGVSVLEITAGAALGGVIQGMSKNPDGAHIGPVPADLAIGLGLNLAAVLDLAGDEYSPHLGNVGTGFLAAFASDKGFSVGRNKRDSGSFFRKGLASGSAASAAVHGEVSADQVAAQLLRNMQG